MPRNLDTALATELANGEVRPCYLCALTLASGVQYLWTGVGSLTWSGNTYIGLGALAEVGAVHESSGVQADGTSISLRADPSTLNQAMSDVRVGAPVKLWFGMLSAAGAIVGAPFLTFSGLVDEPTITEDPSGTRIVLALESRLRNHARASGRRYTAADQKLNYPNDSGFNWVEILNEISLKWGS